MPAPSPLKKKKSIPWSAKEEAILRENIHMPHSALISLLPRRTPMSVQTKVNRLRRANAGNKDTLIKTRCWSAEEEALLNEHAHMPPRKLLAMFPSRSYLSIQTKRCALRSAIKKENGGGEKDSDDNDDKTADFWDVSATAKAFGCSVSTVEKWIERGALRATCSNHQLMIALKALRNFMVAYPREWDHRKMHIEMLLELLVGSDHNTGHGLGGFSYMQGAATRGHEGKLDEQEECVEGEHGY